MSHDSLDHHRSPIYVFHDGKLVTKPDGGMHFFMQELTAFSPKDVIFIGRYQDEPHFALEIRSLEEKYQSRSLRDYLDDPSGVFGQLGRALQLLRWDKTHRYCGQCGSSTERGNQEWVRICAGCGLRSYPRLSPCVIMSVRRGNEILLAQRARAVTSFYTVLAGFVEPGESAEHAVAREVWEEAGIRLKNIRYFDSQPWPFPGQLMLGFFADYAEGDLHPDENELLNAGWYDYRNLPEYPGPNTIAGRLIRQSVRDIESGNVS